MKFPSTMLRWFAALLLALAATTAMAQSQQPQFQAGREYLRLDPPRPVSTGSRIEVLEFFYYGCPICYEFQPHMSRWLYQAPAYVSLLRVPVLSSENWEPFAKLYYTLEILGDVGRLHWPIYDNFHFDGKKLNEAKDMIDWVSHNGVDRDKFINTLESDEVKARLERSRELVRLYEVRGVPSVVVDGKFLTSARLAGGTRQLAQVVDFLVKLARAQRPE
jgi:thiol:disulfide interchange protein DsbA